MAAASSTISHPAVQPEASSASGAIKRKASPANVAITSAAPRAGAVTMASPPRWRISIPASADLPRPRSAVSAAIPGGNRASSASTAACSACGCPSAGCHGGRTGNAGTASSLPCRQRMDALSALTCWQKRKTKFGVGMGSGASLQRRESASGRAGHCAKSGVSNTSQLPARSVPANAAKAATSKPSRASKKACWNSRPSSDFRAADETYGSGIGRGPTHSPSPASAVRTLCA